MTDEKTRLIAELDAERVEFWRLMDALAPDVTIYPGWTKREMLAHVAGWEAVVWEIFNAYISGTPVKPYPHDNLKDIDSANAYFVATHQGATIATAKLECEINRFAIKTLLADIPPDVFTTQEVNFPWGRETFAAWTQGAINHERRHGADMRKLLE